MSWSDDIRCLYCDGRLPLYRKITNGQFCNAAHRKAYWQEQERLAVERLQQTHDSLRVYRPPGAVQAILGMPEIPAPVETPGPEMTGFIRLRLSPMADFLPQLVAAEPLAYEMTAEPLPVTRVGAGIGEGRRIPLASSLPLSGLALPHWSTDKIAGMDPQPLDCAQTPVQRADNRAIFALRIPAADLVDMPLAYRIAAQIPEPAFAGRVTPVGRAMRPTLPESLTLLKPCDDLPFLTPQRQADVTSGSQVPQLDKLLAISRPLALESARTTVREPAAIPVVLRARLPLDLVRLNAALAPAEPIHAGAYQLSMNCVPLLQGASIDNVRAVDLRCVPEAPSFVLSTPAIRPRLRMATGRRYPVRAGEVPVAIADHEPASFVAGPTEVSLPERRDLSVDAAIVPENVESVPQQDPVPGPRGLLPLAYNAKLTQPVPDVLAGPAGVSIPQPLHTQVRRPESKLEPLDAKPLSDFMANPPARPRRSVYDLPGEPVHVWTIAADFWKNAPRDLKMLAFALPILLGLALHPALPKVRVVAPRTAVGMERNLERVVSAQWKSVQQTVLDRAAVALDEDFRSGLDDWASRGDSTTEWSFDATGFVRPGPLALYRPSQGLTDYQMQFLGLIDKKALSWVVRAADFDNYYVVKLVVLKPGPLPTIGLTRYAVINGKADSRSDIVVPLDARPDMLYRVRMDLRGDTFSLVVQGQMVDSWSEPRLRHGGVGFYTARGEESRLRWLQVTHQYDMLGRLCAYLAPYNIPTTSGSWQQ